MDINYKTLSSKTRSYPIHLLSFCVIFWNSDVNFFLVFCKETLLQDTQIISHFMFLIPLCDHKCSVFFI